MNKSQNHFADRIENGLKQLFYFLLNPTRELLFGFKTKTIPLWCPVGALIVSICLLTGFDHFLISKTNLKTMYPYSFVLYKIYYFAFVTFSFWIWAWQQVFLRNKLLSRLTGIFKEAGLVSKIGRMPHFIADVPVDEVSRKLKITNAGFPKEKFSEVKSYLEAGLQVFIDDLKESRDKGYIEIIYAHTPMVQEVVYKPKESEKYLSFVIGNTRSKELTSSFLKHPHLLVAGQTGGGKSTFLRQLIVHLALHNRSSQFLLIDLKGGLEFSLFENKKNITVVPDIKIAIRHLNLLQKVFEERMALLKENKCKDIQEYQTKFKDKQEKLNRHFIIIDEIAEMFLAGSHAKTNDIQSARNVLSKLARQGRAVGIHLTAATQRPDSKSLDPQIKNCLTNVICFQMVNDTSSISVLGNGRATDLPSVPGRAIWKNGIEMIEVQTPFLSVEAAENLLSAIEKEKTESNKDEEISKIENQAEIQIKQSKLDIKPSNFF